MWVLFISVAWVIVSIARLKVHPFLAMMSGAILVGLLSGPLPEPTVENKGLFHNRVDLQDSILVFQFIASCKMESFGFWKHGRRNWTYYCFGCNRWDMYDEKWCSGASCPALTLSFWRKACRVGFIA